MCGRFALHHSWNEMHESYNLIRPEDVGRNVPPRYNIAPTQDVLFVANDQSDRRLLEGRWWLVPFWAKEIPKWTLFNARNEDAYKKPAFREAFKSRRCLIPASGFFEWTKAEDGGKDPHYIYLPDHQPFAFAGLWATNDKLEITSCTILTAPAVAEIEHLHHRMPIILNSDQYEHWLDVDTGVDKARELLKHSRGTELVSHRVSRAVNNSRASGAELIEALS
ncbi:MAG: SOS response-associated peptidase [Pseudomonadota bacterium]